MSCAIEFLSRVTFALDLPDRSVPQKTSSKLGIYILTLSDKMSCSLGAKTFVLDEQE